MTEQIFFRVAAFLGAILVAGLFAACPIFHTTDHIPWFVLLIIYPMLGFLGLLDVFLLVFALRGKF